MATSHHTFLLAVAEAFHIFFVLCFFSNDQTCRAHLNDNNTISHSMTSMKLGYFSVNSVCVLRPHPLTPALVCVRRTLGQKPARPLADRLSIEFLLNTLLQSLRVCFYFIAHIRGVYSSFADVPRLELFSFLGQGFLF